MNDTSCNQAKRTWDAAKFFREFVLVLKKETKKNSKTTDLQLHVSVRALRLLTLQKIRQGHHAEESLLKFPEMSKSHNLVMTSSIPGEKQQNVTG